MNEEDYEKYHQKGGSYIIPVEIFNELFDDYECFKNDCKKYKEVIDKLNIRIKQNKKNIDESGSFVETYTGWKLIPEILEELLDILKEVE